MIQEKSIKLLVAKNIKSYIDKNVGEENFFRRVNYLRSLIKMDKGFLPPRITFTASEKLEPHNYLMKLDDQTADFGQIPTDCLAILGPEEELSHFRGEMIYESFTGQPCKWLSPYEIPPWLPDTRILSGIDILTMHLLELMRFCSYNLFDYSAFLSWKDHQNFVIYRKLLSPSYGENSLLETLRALLKMRFSLNQRDEIYDGIRESLKDGYRKPLSIAEVVRKKLIHELKSEIFDTGSPVYVLYPDNVLIERIDRLKREKFPTLLFIDEFQKILFILGRAIFTVLIQEGVPIILFPPSTRRFVEDITYQIYPELYVFATGDIYTNKQEILIERIASVQSTDNGSNIHSVDVLRWFKGRFEVFKKLKMANYPFYRLAPLRTGLYWISLIRGLSLFFEDKGQAGLKLIEHAEEIKPYYFLPYHIAGEQLFLLGLNKKAIDKFRSAQEKSPAYLDSLVERARDIFREGKTNISLNLLKAILSLDPRNSRAFCTLGEILREQGKRAKAKEALLKSIALSQRNLRARRILGWMYMEEKELKTAEECFREILALDPADPLGRYGLGLAFYHRKKWREAEWEFHRAIRSDPEFHWAYYRLGWLYFHQGKFKLSEQKFLKAIKLNPENIDFHISIGIFYSEIGNYGNAQMILENALKTEPGNIPAREVLARVLWEMGKRKEALKEYRTLLFACPEESSYHYESGILLWEMGNTKEAISAFQNALKWSPQYLPAIEALGWILTTTGEYKMAEKTFKLGRSLEPAYIPFLYGIGCVYYYTSRKDRARETAKSIINIQPDFEWAYYILSKIYHSEGNFPAALENITIALRLNPENTIFICEHASISLECGRMDNVTEELQRLIKREPSCATAHLLLGRFFRKSGKSEQAKIEWLQGISLFPGNSAFYLELFILYEEEGAFTEMKELAEFIDKHLAENLVGTIIQGLIKLSNFELPEAKQIFLYSTEKAPSICNSYLALISFLLKEYDTSFHYMKLAKKHRGEEILRDSYIAELMCIKGRADSFEVRCLKYLKENPGDQLTIKNLGEFYLKTGRIDKAGKYLRKALEANPRLHRIHSLMAEFYYRKGLLKKSESVVSEGMTIFPRHPEFYIRMGQFFFERGKGKEGELHIRQGMMMAPLNLKLFYLMYLELNRGNFTEIERIYDGLPEHIKKNNETLILMSSVLLNQKKYDEALSFLNQAMDNLTDRFTMAELYYKSAIIYWLKGMKKKTKRHLLLAQKLVCGVGNAMLSEAFLLLLDGNLEDAQKLVQRACKRRPAFAEAYFLLGNIFEKKGEMRRAKKWYKKALKIFPWSIRYLDSFEKVREKSNRETTSFLSVKSK